MSIELPKYSIQVAENKPSLFKKTLPVFMLFIGLVLGYSGYKFWTDKSIKTLIESNKALEQIKLKFIDIENMSNYEGSEELDNR